MASAWHRRLPLRLAGCGGGDPTATYLVCEEQVDPRSDFANGRWLVTDRQRGLVYYRIWKKYP